MSKIQSLELHAVSVDLVPVKNWRAILPRRGMNYKVFGRAKDENGKPIAVSVVVNALSNGELRDLGGNPDISVVASLLAKNSDTIDSLRLKYSADGKPVTDGEGRPVYDEAVPIGFDPAYGTYFFCVLHPGLRFSLKGAELTPSVNPSTGAQRMAKDDTGEPTVPVFDAVVDALCAEPRAAAGGRSLLGSVSVGATAGGRDAQAARAASLAVSHEAEM